MGKEIIIFGDIEVEKHKIRQHKSLILLYDVKIDREVMHNMGHLVKKSLKYFIGY